MPKFYSLRKKMNEKFSSVNGVVYLNTYIMNLTGVPMVDDIIYNHLHKSYMKDVCSQLSSTQGHSDRINNVEDFIRRFGHTEYTIIYYDTLLPNGWNIRVPSKYTGHLVSYQDVHEFLGVEDNDDVDDVHNEFVMFQGRPICVAVRLYIDDELFQGNFTNPEQTKFNLMTKYGISEDEFYEHIWDDFMDLIC